MGLQPDSSPAVAEAAIEGVETTSEARTQETGIDQIWIQQTLDGNSEAFGNLHQKYQPRFLGMALRILRNREDAEDVLEEAFIDAYRHLPDFQNKSRFSTWLYSIVMNHIRNRIRRNKVIRWSSLDSVPSTEDDARPMDFPEIGPPIDNVLDHKLQLEAVHEAVKTFPPLYGAIFTRFYFDGMLLQDIATELERPLGTIKAYLHHARKLLYKRLAYQPQDSNKSLELL